MYKTISNKIIRTFNPCYDPSKYITDENEELPIKDWVQKYRKLVPANDIIWLLLREEFLSEKDLILFAVWCAREALKLVENPDHRSIEACNVAERYANGEATQEELLAARVAAYPAVDIDAYTVAYAVYYAAYYAAYTARAAAYFAARVSAYASDAAYITAYIAAATAARDTVSLASADASDAARAATHASQIDQLLTYFE
jgi:hypothetical protein